jgi:PAS domain S-box-containing protein
VEGSLLPAGKEASLASSERSPDPADTLQTSDDFQLPTLTLLNALHDGVVVMRADGAIVHCNRSAERILGLSVDQMTGRTTHDPRWQAIHEDGSPFPGEMHPVSVSLRTGQPVHNVVMGVRKPTGELTWIIINSEPLVHPDSGRPYAVVASFTDITELKQAEARFRLLFDANPLPMWVYEAENLRFLAVNEAAVRHYGYTREEFSRMTLADIRPPAEVPRLLERSHDESFRRDGSSQGEWKHRTKDGREIAVEIFADEITFEGRLAKLVIAHDITERHKLEAQLRQAQKMEAVGRLAGGVAHDFNNVLSVVGGYADLLLKDLAADDPRLRRLELIRKTVESGASLTRQLLAFSRRQPVELKAVDVAGVVRAIEPMVSRLIGEQHELIVRTEPSSPMVKADGGQMEQVVMNLAINARDAMPSGGKLLIETKSVVLDESFARTHLSAAAGPYVILSVSDTGMGMDAETRSRIFEPFFTTKAEGKGTGLGLATVYGIVKQSGGYIGVYSEVGQGSTFNIYFPCAEPAEASAAVDVQPDSVPIVGSGTVLLVEDGDSLREMMREMLEASGYSVLEANNPNTALSLLENARGERIDLLLTDVVMPGMRGPELAERLRVLSPGLKVLFMSGYTDETVSVQGLVHKDAQFIQKPFTQAALLTKVLRVLDRVS